MTHREKHAFKENFLSPCRRNAREAAARPAGEASVKLMPDENAKQHTEQAAFRKD